MNPLTHLLAGWTLGAPFLEDRRGRVLVTLASLAPDLDGAGLILDLAAGHGPEQMAWFSRFHHVLGHNVGFALAVAAGAAALARSRRARVGLLSLGAVHLHLLGDLVGSRGPDGWSWPIPYLLPFSPTPELSVSWQWALDAWPNLALTGALLALALGLARWRGASPVEILSLRADRAVVEAIRRRLP